MNVIPSLCAALAVAVFTADALAHGGMYRGPGSAAASTTTTTGNSSSGGGSGSGNSNGSNSNTSSSSGSGPSTPGPAAASGGGGAVSAGSSNAAPLEDDMTRWAHFWEFRKDPFLRLKAAVHDPGIPGLSDTYYMGSGPRVAVDTLMPSPAQIRNEIVPALHRALESTSQRDITSSCLVALAKIGIDTDRHDLLDALCARLTSHDQEIRETAALSLGISQRTAAIPSLVGLLQDTETGRALCDRATVDDRTRSFAAYGLGLIAWATESEAVKRVVLDALRKVLDDDSIAGMNVHVAVVNAIGLLRPGSLGQRPSSLRADALDVLEEFYERDLGVGRQLVQAHVPTAAATLLAGETDPAVREVWAKRLVVALESPTGLQKGARRNRSLPQSAALALGELARPNESDSPDEWISDVLMRTFENNSDQQTSNFALAALGRIGGDRNRRYLINKLRSGSKALEKPWAALALGMLEYRRQQAAGLGAVADQEIVGVILAQMQHVKNPDTLGAFSVALGLARASDAAPELRELLAEHRHQDEFAGYLCIGLGLMGDNESVGAIRDITSTSARRPQLLVQAAVALGRLGDKTAAMQLMAQMTATQQNIAVLASLAFAVGQIGDRRSVAPLIEIIEDTARADLARAFAVVALGGVADKELEPWNAKIGRQVNYRAAVETLTNQASGILDIL